MSADATAARPGRPPVPLALSRLAHDRAAHHRSDTEWLATAWPNAQVLVVRTDGQLACDDDQLLLLTGETVPARVEAVLTDNWPDRIFLGVGETGPIAGAAAENASDVGAAEDEAVEPAYFAVVVGPDAPPPAGTRWASLRDVGAEIGELEAGLSVAAVALVAFHSRTRFCPHCGAPSEAAQAGWVRRCTVEGIEIFPRSDPAVIMLVHDGGDRCVLGRQQVWPEGRFSVLAGFVEAGEPIEATVAREVGEEVGLDVTDVRYVGSQPWPFPQSLMIGCTARATTTEIVRRDNEIAEAYWFTRAEVAQAVGWDEAGGGLTSDAGEKPGIGPGGAMTAIPGPVSIARQLIDAWIDGRI